MRPFVIVTAAVLAPAAARADAMNDMSAAAAAYWPLTLVAALSVMAIGFLLHLVRRLNRAALETRRQMSDLETDLNEAEAALGAEPNILMIWRGSGEAPDRILGDMRGTADVPADRRVLPDFDRWLEPESAQTVKDHLIVLREIGKPFNFGIRTTKGELLEVDGRSAGGSATLRFRTLAGERRQTTELTLDARKLGKQVERLSAILDAAPLAIWLDDPEQHLLWANRAYVDSVEDPDFEGMLARQTRLVDPARIEYDATQPLKNVKRGRAHTVIAGRKTALDVYEVRLSEGTVSFAVDMTLLEETQKELKRHIRAHASTLDKLATAIAIFGPDRRLRFYNSAYAELWGLETGWLDQHPLDGEILDRLREMRRLPEQENFKDWKARQLAAYQTLEPREMWWHLPSGQTLRVISEQHPFGGVTYLYENVTELIRLESQFKELIGVQRETMDNLHEGVALFGTDGKLKLFNPSFTRFWSLDPERLTSEPHIDDVIALCRPLYPDDDIWDDVKVVATSLDTGRRSLQGRMMRPDSTVLDYATVPLPDGNTLLTFVDMTASAGIERALRERNDALEAADKLKTNFLSNVSYELRTPLTNIIGFSEGLTLGIAGPMQPKQVEYLKHIRTSSNDLLSIIDAILDLTTIDAGRMELRLASVDVATLLESTAEAAAPEIERRDLQVSIELAEDATSFLADEKRVRQVVTNLLSNAIGFSDPGATIRMGARRDGPDMVLWVADTGRGIDPDYQTKVFERFQARPISGGHRGPGLGLSLVKSFVELHEGKVSLISRVGSGTTVICRFPVDGPGHRSLVKHA
ncbi:MAG: ATP-binding protein [Hyphomicrobiales bacterium]